MPTSASSWSRTSLTRLTRRNVRQRVMSFIAYAKHCNAFRTVEGVLGDLVLVPGLRDIPARYIGNERIEAA